MQPENTPVTTVHPALGKRVKVTPEVYKEVASDTHSIYGEIFKHIASKVDEIIAKRLGDVSAGDIEGRGRIVGNTWYFDGEPICKVEVSSVNNVIRCDVVELEA